MWKRSLKITGVLTLVLMPMGIWWLYRGMTRFPDQVTIAVGMKGGQYRVLGESLKREIEKQLDVNVVLRSTDGSLENLLALRSAKADFAFYQPGAMEVLRMHDHKLVERAESAVGLRSATEGEEDVAFIASMYMQSVQFIVRSEAGITRPEDLSGRRVSVGLAQSGDYAMSLVLLEHFGLGKGGIQRRHLKYDDVVNGLVKEEVAEEQKLDAACITLGSPAPVLTELFRSGKCDLLEVPHVKALTFEHVFLSEHVVPSGLYQVTPVPRPARDIKTVAVPAQLLARQDVNPYLVQAVAQIVLDKRFARYNGLKELLDLGREFARSKPEFSIHPGAEGIYDPEFDVHLIESWEAAYSLAVSIIIAAFFGIKWIKRRNERRAEHKLDRYIRSLLDIEEQQVGLDVGSATDDVEPLQRLLDEVTVLRQKALHDFSMHELNEDRGADCFIEMCHGLSSKINAKILRQRIDNGIQKLLVAAKDEDGKTS